jgi:CheY-like chemotaxis protein
MVDDEFQFRATTEKILNSKGFDTVMAASGEEAIAKLAEQPDVIVLDIKMPGMDGHAALAEIKKRVPGLPVIMLTGHGALPSAQDCLAEGAYDYLSKPCDIELLAAKIKDAHTYRAAPEQLEEKRVIGVMVPLKEYTTLKGDVSIKKALFELKTTFSTKMSTPRFMETGHRSILVMDDDENILGILAIRDLLVMIMPPYLTASKPSTADSIQYSPLFWKGMFSQTVQAKAEMKIQDVMSPAPPSIDGKASLMEAAYRMVDGNVRRLVVTLSGRVSGVIREQDLFFEMEKILRG